MKKVTVTIEFDEVKFKALKKFIAKRNVTIASLLELHLETLYKKYVPASVREYLKDETTETALQIDKKKGK